MGANAENQRVANDTGVGSLGSGVSLEQLLRRPELDLPTLIPLAAHVAPGLALDALSEVDAEVLEIQVKYDGYIKRQRDLIDRQRSMEDALIPSDFDYAGVHGLTAEVRQKLTRVAPRTLGQAARISGVTPAAISAIMISL